MVKLNQGTVSTSDQDREEGKVKIYPNPASNWINVQLVTSASLSGPIEAVRISDLSGRTVATYPWQGAEIRSLSAVTERSRGGVEVDVSALPSGFYLLQVLGQDRILAMEKLVID
jgi:hypothetical protein